MALTAFFFSMMIRLLCLFKAPGRSGSQAPDAVRGAFPDCDGNGAIGERDIASVGKERNKARAAVFNAHVHFEQTRDKVRFHRAGQAGRCCIPAAGYSSRYRPWE